jgi:hypothetical protein
MDFSKYSLLMNFEFPILSTDVAAAKEATSMLNSGSRLL